MPNLQKEMYNFFYLRVNIELVKVLKVLFQGLGIPKSESHQNTKNFII